MTSFDDYEVLNILGTNLHSTCYKVKDKKSSGVYVWKAVNYETCGFSSETVVEKVNQRKDTKHPILLPVHNFIHHQETSTIYLVTEFCKHGSILDVAQRCKQNQEYLHEDFIWNTLYKLACYFKISESNVLNLHEIFIDSEFDIRILNFTLDTPSKKANDVTGITTILKAMIYQPSYYSKELHCLQKFFLEPDPGINPTVDAILCHPTVLMKIGSQMETIFIKCPETQVASELQEVENTGGVLHAKLEGLRNREAALKVTEEKLKERSRDLDRREKKVVLIERLTKEKMVKAELYLKRARESRSAIGSSKGSLTTKKELIDSIDFSYSPECGDSSTLPKTSCKLNVQEITKPTKFTRTLSERRVRFKSHSPLKEIHNFKREAQRAYQQPELRKPPVKLDTIQSDSDKASETNSEKSGIEKTKRKFLLGSMFSRKPCAKKLSSIGSSSESVSAHTYEDIDSVDRNIDKDWRDSIDCKPINWTEDSKRQAFDLLRAMNGGAKHEQFKHTFL